MAKFLLFIPLPKTNAPVAEQLVRSAICFLETQGKSSAGTSASTSARAGRTPASRP